MRKVIFFYVVLLFSSIFVQGFLRAESSEREQIGEVLGKPVYRDEIRTSASIPLSSELHRLFTQPVMEEYRRKHKAEFEPTSEELSRAAHCIDQQHAHDIKDEKDKLQHRLKQIDGELAVSKLSTEQRDKLQREREYIELDLKPMGVQVASWMVPSWKFQRHLYESFGQGRIHWQQAGTEAFDAMWNWLKLHEKERAFTISDPALHKEFYGYWTALDKSPLVKADTEGSLQEFLNPSWLKVDCGKNEKVKPANN